MEEKRDTFAHLSKNYRYRMTAEQLSEQEKRASGSASSAPSAAPHQLDRPDSVQFLPDTDYKTKAWMLCREYLTGRWGSVEEASFQIRRISGGLTNHIFHCSLPQAGEDEGGRVAKKRGGKKAMELHQVANGKKSGPGKGGGGGEDEDDEDSEPADVLLRLYGGGPDDTDQSLTSYITSHVIDNVVFTILSERGLGPKLYGVFPEGRLEEFIHARSMTPEEVRDPTLSAIIARKVAKIHSLSTPINKERDWLSKMFRRYQTQVEQISLSDVDPKHHPLAKELLYFDFKKETDWLLDYLSRAGSPVVFCHNDVQGGNVLLRKDVPRGTEDSVMIIDYEFCGYNYRGYDLANHLCEWVYDYSNKAFPYYHCQREYFPSKERQMEFLRAYLTPEDMPVTVPKNHLMDVIPDEANGTAAANGEAKTDEIPDDSPPRRRRRRTRSAGALSMPQKPGSGKRHAESFESRVETLYSEVQSFLLAPRLLWCMWAIVQSSNDQIPFGYWEYAADKMKDYEAQKKRLLGQERDH